MQNIQSPSKKAENDKQEEEQHVVVRLFAIRYFRILYIFIQMFSFFLNMCFFTAKDDKVT